MVMNAYTRTSIRPIQVGPSIQEGEINNPSLLHGGPRVGIGIDRRPITLISSPRIRGTIPIPSTLSVLDAVVDASPQPYNVSYQWTRDGVSISGEEGKTYTSVAADNATQIKCNITLRHSLGDLTISTSNGLTPALYEDVSNFEYQVYVVTGQETPTLQTVRQTEVMFVTGMNQDNLSLFMEFDIYVVTEQGI